MNWPTFLTPWWGLLGLLAVPLIVLYILRQKRPNMPISSTLLWSKALADMRASTPFQKLRRNLLLLLQLLILAAVVLALMRPVVQSQAQATVAGVIVIDDSASMQATDGGGPSRLERAKQEAHRLIDGMRPGDRYMVLADGGGVMQLRGDFNTDKRDLHRQIDNIQPSDASSDLSETLLIGVEKLKSIGQVGKSAGANIVGGKIWLISDGVGVKLPTVAELPKMLEYVRIGESSNNVGITSLTVMPVDKKGLRYQVFAGLFNASNVERKVVVGLAAGKPDNWVGTQTVTLAPRQTGAAQFEGPLEPGRIYAVLDGKNDDFALDNVAYGLVEPVRKARVKLYTAGNAMLERFVRTATATGEMDGTIIDAQRYTADAPADLVIIDGFAPKELPKCDVLLIRPGAGVGGFKVIGEMDKPVIVRWRREDPLLAYVDLSEVRVFRALHLERDSEATELVSTPDGPLLVSKDYGSSRRYLLGFDIMMESNWWRDSSLLIFMQNVVNETRRRHFIGTPQVLPTGQAAMLWDLGETATVHLPAGGEKEIPTQAGAAEFAETEHVGFYDVTSGDRKAEFAVNLLSQDQSDIAPRSLETQEGGNVKEATSVALVNREIWLWVALAGLGILMVEWWFYHRRLA